ncbi:MAG: hypothetical protein J5I93_04820, partial [Pirellulaceae bacterium]|nr:hypothetical protein [Pirellulaceae bacterium]
MSVSPSNLISLLRLLDRTLPAGEAGMVRERLAGEPELAVQYRLVLRAMQPAADIDALLTHADDLDVSEVAEFVEGRMSAERQASFESRCWSSEGVLREVIAAWQAAGEAAALEQAVASTDDARAAARSLLRAHPPAQRLPRARPLEAHGVGLRVHPARRGQRRRQAR